MADEWNILRVGRHDLRFMGVPGVYVLAKRRASGRVNRWWVGESDDVRRDYKCGAPDFAEASREGFEDAVVLLERDPEARRRLTLAVAAALMRQQ